MKSPHNNICKFVMEDTTNILSTLAFVYEKRNATNGRTTVKSTNNAYLCSAGTGVVTIDEKKYSICPGILFFAFKGESVCFEGDDSFEYMYIRFSGARCEELFDRFGINSANRIFNGGESLLPFWQSALSKADTKNLDLLSECVLLYTFSQMSQVPENSEQFLTGNIIKCIEANFSDSNLSLDSASQMLGYSSKYISRIFKKNTGVTFSEHLRATRIKHAVFLMENGVTSVKNVSLLSGYADPFYFSNVFKASVGMSPSEFLKKGDKE